MSFGEIIIYVIAGIAAIGFIMGLIGAIMQWREDGVLKWTAPIFGLFIIFLLPLAFIIETIDFYKESKKDGGLRNTTANRNSENKRTSAGRKNTKGFARLIKKVSCVEKNCQDRAME